MNSRLVKACGDYGMAYATVEAYEARAMAAKRDLELYTAKALEAREELEKLERTIRDISL